MPAWNPHGLTVVWFFDGVLSVDRETLFKALTNMVPQGQQMGQAPQPAGGQVWTLTGQDGRYNYQTTFQANRVDFAITPAPPAIPPDQGMPLMDGSSAIDHIINMAIRATSLIGESSRLAFVGDFAQPTSNVAEANHELATILNQPSITEDTVDLVFQMNIRRPMQSLRDMQMNRVLNWNTVVVQTYVFNAQLPAAGLFPGVASSMGAPGMQIKESFAAGLRIDLNTHSILARKISAPEQDALFTELSEEMKKLNLANSPAGLL
ncbi:hypothetical protein [Methylobacterium sp. 77]|uniref:hypothetical protein n=1 Tax=Methylobacterium sp. 77 TaxID=1101192 RepID=UPI0012DE027D|nr:hypothetical protein [Methylobacterium sp. 77]